ncbi:class I SAM-dependent methyltransferase [Brevundimonas lutea]|uniref:class I SAM-dependent methyltransferase n=1 Tax=Brevundimonas lutea TaxID=2293980 RepID=UPI000F02DA41|nr:class I SAM-dependent methyltransferase [Brevundimonas lutea]
MALETVLRGYADASADQIGRMEGFDPAQLLAPVTAVLSTTAGRMLDVGAGTGYVAGWFAKQGHEATAVEPVDALPQAGERIRGDRIRWLDDQLPQLNVVRALHEQFDLIVLSAVWQHLDETMRARAMATLAALVADGGQIILSVRHGPGAATRPVFATTADETIALASRNGLSVRLAVQAESLQAGNRAMGVRWTWLSLSR